MTQNCIWIESEMWHVSELSHIASINTQMTIIRELDSLKWKPLSETFRDVAMWWYMGLPHAFISIYQELVKKLVHQFTANHHRKMFIASIFNIQKGLSKSLRNYLTRFNKAIIRVVPQNREMFMGEFQNGLKEWHFNKSLAQKPTLSLAEVVTRAKCYIKGEGSNIEKKVWDVEERVPNSEGSHNQRKSNYTSPIKDNTTFKRKWKTTKSSTPLSTHRGSIWREVFHLHNIPTPSSLKANVMGHEPKRLY